MKTRDLCFKWSYWRTLVFSDEIKIDTRYVCPKDVKKMLVQRVRSVYWKKWTAKHEYEELKEGAWLGPGLAVVRKKEKRDWTEKHRNMARKIFLEGGWLDARKIIRYWMVGRQSVSSLSEGGRHRKAQAVPLSGMARSEARHSGSFQELGAKGENTKERMEMGKKYSRTPTQ